MVRVGWEQAPRMWPAVWTGGGEVEGECVQMGQRDVQWRPMARR